MRLQRLYRALRRHAVACAAAVGAIALWGVCAGYVAAAARPAPEAHGLRSTYPARPVRLIVPFAPGGSDVPARMLAQKLSEKLGQPFVVDNRPGAAGVLGADITAKAAPDGYTLLFVTASHAVTAVYYEKLPFDSIRDFAPVGAVGSVPFSLAAHPSLSVSSLREFVALAKTKPGQLNYSSPGTGSIGHLANVLLAEQTGTQVTHVAYKGVLSNRKRNGRTVGACQPTPSKKAVNSVKLLVLFGVHALCFDLGEGRACILARALQDQ